MEKGNKGLQTNNWVQRLGSTGSATWGTHLTALSISLLIEKNSNHSTDVGGVPLAALNHVYVMPHYFDL